MLLVAMMVVERHDDKTVRASGAAVAFMYGVGSVEGELYAWCAV